MKKNKGTFIARNIGVLFSKGKYIILPDPDDILSRNILNNCYNYCKKYDYDMIKFIIYRGNKQLRINKIFTGDKPLYQPELSTNIFYGRNELEKIDFSICNKFLKKEVYIRGLNIIRSFYLNKYIIYFEDQII